MEPITGTALSLGGALLGALGQSSKARQTNHILGEGSREQQRAGQESAGVMGDFIGKLRQSAPDAGAERGAFMSAMRGPGVRGPMTASRQFQGDARNATAGAQGYGQNLADLFARIRAPGLQRQREGQLLTNAGNALRPIQMRAQDQDFMTKFRAGQVKENPLYSIAGQGLQGLGNYMIGG